MPFDETVQWIWKGVIRNFEECGCVAPTLFFESEDGMLILPVGSYFQGPPSGKDSLRSLIDSTVADDRIKVVGLVNEAWIATFEKAGDDFKRAEDLCHENRLGEFEGKQEVLMMVLEERDGQAMTRTCLVERKGIEIELKMEKDWNHLEGNAWSEGRFVNFFNRRRGFSA
jgi:hypothetical protein